MPRIFVFGSNLAGRHGKGAALTAKERHGAIYGQGEGLQGRCYAIPTKDGRPPLRDLKDPRATLSISDITGYVNRFLDFARSRPDLEFDITPIGCGQAGYTPNEIAPLFVGAPANCLLPEQFVEALRKLGKAQELKGQLDMFSSEPVGAARSMRP